MLERQIFIGHERFAFIRCQDVGLRDIAVLVVTVGVFHLQFSLRVVGAGVEQIAVRIVVHFIPAVQCVIGVCAGFDEISSFVIERFDGNRILGGISVVVLHRFGLSALVVGCDVNPIAVVDTAVLFGMYLLGQVSLGIIGIGFLIVLVFLAAVQTDGGNQVAVLY